MAGTKAQILDAAERLFGEHGFAATSLRAITAAAKVNLAAVNYHLLKYIVGSFVADNSRARMASGEVRAFDASTGALRWTFHPLPPDAGAGGANTWSQIVVDEPNGLVFLRGAEARSRPRPARFSGAAQVAHIRHISRCERVISSPDD